MKKVLSLLFKLKMLISKCKGNFSKNHTIYKKLNFQLQISRQFVSLSIIDEGSSISVAHSSAKCKVSTETILFRRESRGN